PGFLLCARTCAVFDVWPQSPGSIPWAVLDRFVFARNHQLHRALWVDSKGSRARSIRARETQSLLGQRSMAYEQNAVPPATALRSSSASAKALSRAHLDRRRSAAAHGLRRDDITRVSAAALAQSDGSEARFPSPQCTEARNHVPMSALQRASFCLE